MKALLSTEAGRKKIEAELEKVQARSRTRTISMEELLKAGENICSTFCCIPIKYREGITVDSDIRAQHFPQAYDYIPESTHVVFTFGKSHLYVTKIYRGRCRTPNKHFETRVLPDIAKESIIKSYAFW